MMTAMLTVENIEAGSRKFNIWNVNEDAEYHEAGDEGAEKMLDAPQTGAASASAQLTEGQKIALQSERDVPQRVEAKQKINRAA